MVKDARVRALAAALEYEGSEWFEYVNPHGGHEDKIRSHPRFLPVSQYRQGYVVVMGEIGRIGNVRYIVR